MKTLFPTLKRLARRAGGWLVVLFLAAPIRAIDVTAWHAFGAGGAAGQAGRFGIRGSFGSYDPVERSAGRFGIVGGFLVAANARVAVDPPPVGAPTISSIGPQVVTEDEQTGFIPFQIADSNTAVGALIITRDSSDPAIVPLTGIILGGISSNRTVRIRPAANASGAVLITLSVSDGGNTTRESFLVNVQAVNDPPTLSRILNAVVNEDSATDELQFVVGDIETPAGDLVVSASAADPGLVPAGGIVLGGTGANRWLKIVPAPNHFGGTTITYRVTDGEATSEQTFPFTVISNNDAPSVTPIADVSIVSGDSTTVEFTIADVDHSLAEVTVNVQSDNAALISNDRLKRTDLGGGRHSLMLTPITGRTGIAVITITAADPRGAAGRSQLKLTVTPAVPKLDFGDAPQVYPVLLAASGARHTIKPGYFLGSGVDAEADGQPNPTATGDDTNAPDDEDGVRFPLNTAGQAILYNGHAGLGANFSSNTIIATASAAGKLDAWVDFNRDGDWNDPGEQIFKSRALVAGVNTLSVVVSNTAAVGATFVRFRLSSLGNLPPAGAAEDGEVEDYGVLIAPAQAESRNLFGGLRYNPVGDGQVDPDPKGWLMISNLTAQATRGVSFELGQAVGVEGGIIRQRITGSNQSVALRFRGSQGGQARDLVQVKWENWEGPDLDATKNDVSIETLEITPDGLTYKEANVRLFNQRGELVFTGKYGVGGFNGIEVENDETHVRQLGDTATHEVGHWMGVASDTARFEDSPAGGGMHFVRSWREDSIVSPRDSASGLPTGRRVTMPDGESVGGVAFGIFSYEGLTQPVDFLERVEVLGSGVSNSFGLSKVGLLYDDFRMNGGGNTRLSGNHKGELNGGSQPFFFLPEVEDEVVVSFSEAQAAAVLLGKRPCCYLPPYGALNPLQFQLPEGTVGAPGSTLRMSAIQFPKSSLGAQFNPKELGLGRSFIADILWPGVTAGAQPAAGPLNPVNIRLSYSGSNTASARFEITAFGNGKQVEAFSLDGKGTDVNVEEVELVVSGTGRLASVQPAFLSRGQTTPDHRLIFDRPMTVTVAGKTFEASELSFALQRGMWPQTENMEFSGVIQGPRTSPLGGGTTIYADPGTDWGDLPFETTQAQNGPSHHLSREPILRLGGSVDREPDGRATLDATGDDVDRSPSDEDGVTFAAVAVPGTFWNFSIEVHGVPFLGSAYVDAFVDWNFNNAFEIASGEKILDRQWVHNGGNLFTVPVPLTATPGQKYARFRLSTAGGLGSGGPAEDGEVEDYVIRVEPNPTPKHLSGLVPLPRGAASVRSTAGGGIEISELGGNAAAGLSLLAPSNVVSRSAGRILLPLNPPMPIISFESQTQPFADGLVLEAHYSKKNSQRGGPSLRFQSDCTTKPCDLLRVSVGGCIGRSDEIVRVVAFVDGRSIGNIVVPCGELGTFKGNAKMTQLGWAAFPASAMVLFDQDVTFTSAEGRSMSARQYRFSMGFFDGYEEGGNVVFDGVDVYGSALGASGASGFSNLKVVNPQVPSIRELKILPGGIFSAEFTAEESVFYRLEETTFGPQGWTAANGFSEIIGDGSPRTLNAPSEGNVSAARFFRLRAE